MKVDESWWKLMKVDESCWKYIGMLGTTLSHAPELQKSSESRVPGCFKKWLPFWNSASSIVFLPHEFLKAKLPLHLRTTVRQLGGVLLRQTWTEKTETIWMLWIGIWLVVVCNLKIQEKQKEPVSMSISAGVASPSWLNVGESGSPEKLNCHGCHGFAVLLSLR